MNHRKLLENAAKATGYKPVQWDEVGWLFVEGDRYRTGSLVRWCWDPINDDGDCARMEAAVGIYVVWGRLRVICYVRAPDAEEEIAELFFDHANDRQAARRLASTRAAAAVWDAKGGE